MTFYVPGSSAFVGCTDKRWVSLAHLKTRSRLEWPEFEDDGGFQVSCGHCDNCIRRRVENFTGRMKCEAVGAEFCYFVTLSIGGDKYLQPRGQYNERAHEFDKGAMQNLMKRLKVYQYREWWEHMEKLELDPAFMCPPSLRYVYVGERGSKGTYRVHYHLLVYMTGWDMFEGVPQAKDIFLGKMHETCNPKDYPEFERIPDKRTFWPYGFVHIKPVDDLGAMHYVAKYINKDAVEARGAGRGSVMRPGYSTQPLFGGFYLDDWARRHVVQGLSPQDAFYSVPDRPGYRGRSARFLCSKAAATWLCNSFADQWDAEFVKGRGHPEFAPESPFVRRFFEARADRQLGTPELAMARSSFFMVLTARRDMTVRDGPVSMAELVEQSSMLPIDKRHRRGMLEIPRTLDRIARMGNRIELRRVLDNS